MGPKGGCGSYSTQSCTWRALRLFRCFATRFKNAGTQNGGFMPMAEQHGDAPSFWLPYFTVSSRDGAVRQARELGGSVLAGPLDLPAGKIAILADPQGAAFAVFEGETDE